MWQDCPLCALFLLLHTDQIWAGSMYKIGEGGKAAMAKPNRVEALVVGYWGPALVQIEVDLDSVTIEGQKVLRPSYICRWDWSAFWRDAKNLT